MQKIAKWGSLFLLLSMVVVYQNCSDEGGQLGIFGGSSQGGQSSSTDNSSQSNDNNPEENLEDDEEVNPPPVAIDYSIASVRVDAGLDCPANYVDHGLIGTLLESGKTCPHNDGGTLNSGWNWCHSRLCTGTIDSNSESETIAYIHPSESCGAGFVDDGLGGFILRNDSTCPFGGGGTYGAEWTWCHPRVCRSLPGFSFTKGSVFYAQSEDDCPQGYTGVGRSGFILNNSETCNYSPGGAYNSGWTWCHPYMCVRNE